MVLSETSSTLLTSAPCRIGFSLQAEDGMGTLTMPSDETRIWQVRTKPSAASAALRASSR